MTRKILTNVGPQVPPQKLKRPAAAMNEDDARLFDNIAEEVFHGDRELFDSLTVHERAQVIAWLSDAMVDGNPANAIHDLLWELDFKYKPVSIEEFIFNEYYFGKGCSELNSKWVEDLKYVFAPGSPVQEWIMTGAIGIGKTTVAGVALGYKTYYISCLRDPSKYYGLLPNSPMYFGVYSITKQQVMDSCYPKLLGWVDSSPYFREQFPRDDDIDSRIRFTRSPVQIVCGSTEINALGLDMFSFAMDEVNFMKAKTAADGEAMTGQAYDLYNSTTSRLSSRYQRPGGTLPGIAILLSSRNAETSFLEERIRKQKGKITTFISDYPLWAVKSKSDYATIWDMEPPPGTPPKFQVQVGDRISKSKLLLPAETPREGVRVVTIPGEMRAKFEEDVDQALRDLAGIATFNLSPLISDRKSIYDAIRTNLTHPFTEQCVTLDVRDDEFLQSYFKLTDVCKIVDSAYRARLNPGCPRFIHGDLGLTGDCAAIAMCHMSGFKRMEKQQPDGTISKVENPFVLFDFMLRIVPPAGSEIDFSKIRGFILYLCKYYNVEIATFDGFQSADMLQLLRKGGLQAKQLSLDKSEDPYISLRGAHYERRIAMYEYAPYIDEMLDLQRHTREKKVDHPQKNSKGGKGSKDVADAACGAYWNCILSETALKSAPPVGDEDIVSGRIVDPMNKGQAQLTQTGEKSPFPMTPDNPSQKKSINGMRVGWDNLRGNLKR